MSEHQVTELAPGDIQRGGEGAARAGGQQQAAGFREDGSAQPVAEMAPAQQASLTRVAELKQRFLDPSLTSEQRERLTQTIVAHQRHAFGTGPNPEAQPDPKMVDQRPHDSLRDAMEAANAPATKEVLAFAVTNSVAQGVDRNLAQGAVDLCRELGLSGGAVTDILARVRAHHGADHEYGPETQLRVLDAAGIKDFTEVAAEYAGSIEKFEALQERAKDLLRHKGVLEYWEKIGLTRTSLFFDPRALSVLSRVADAAGVPRGKR